MKAKLVPQGLPCVGHPINSHVLVKLLCDVEVITVVCNEAAVLIRMSYEMCANVKAC